MLWVLVGCAVLLVVGLCAASGFALFFVYAGQTPYPDGPPPPTPTPMPQRPMVQTPQGPQPQLPPPPVNYRPLTVSAVVTQSTTPRVTVGTRCVFPVTRHDRQGEPTGYWCRAEIRCGTELVYGGGTAGYFPCTVVDSAAASVVGGEAGTTTSDGDAAVQLNTPASRLTVSDDPSGRIGAYSIEARIESVR